MIFAFSVFTTESFLCRNGIWVNAVSGGSWNAAGENGRGGIFEKCSNSGKGGTMRLKSAYEDLRERTLGKIEGIWGKLAYIAERRSQDGTYQHWGLERVHGAAVAQEAFVRAHYSLVNTILQTRLRLLREDLAQTSGTAGTNSVSYVRELKAGLPRLLPSDCPKMTELHLISVLTALASLETHSQSGRQAASPRPRLGR